MKKIYILPAFLVLFGLGACEDDLNQVPISEASVGNFFRNTADFQQAVNGVYNSLRPYPDRIFQLSETRSDNLYSVGLDVVREHNLVNNFDLNLATNPLIEEAWNANYAGIYRANTLLDQLQANPGAVANATLRSRFEGEARFLRAFYYFDLVRLYGRVPLIDRTMGPTEVLNVPQSSPADIYSRVIVPDLQFAIQNLPPTYPAADRGRATAHAARALLALVHLTRSGPTYGIAGPGLGVNEYGQALQLLNEVIASGVYSFLPNYANIFSYTNENNAEVVFDIQFQGGGLGLGATYPGTMAPSPYFTAVGIPFPAGLEIRPVSNNLLNSYPANDARRPVNFQIGYTDPFGVFEPRAFIRKWLNEQRPGVDRFDWPINFIVIRYTDVLMMKAEAILQGGGGSPAEVDQIVTQVRQRAGLGPVSGVTLPTLMEERRREFAGEGQRWHDLVRSGLVLDVMNAWIPVEDGTANRMPRQIDANQLIYPVPTRQMDVRVGLYEQNPGY